MAEEAVQTADVTSMSDEELDSVLYSDTGSDENLGSGDPAEQEADVSPVEESSEDEREGYSDEGDAQSEEPESETEDSASTDEDTPSSEEEEATSGEDESEEANAESSSEKDSKSGEELVPIKANGKEYPVESMDELYRLASMGIAAHQKWQAAAEGRKVMKTLESNGLTMDDINLLVDLKKGNKDAITALLKQAEVDPIDLDLEEDSTGYAPNNYVPDEIELQIDEVVERVRNNPKFEDTVNVMMEQWDERSREAFFQNPEILELLNIDMQPDPKTGISVYDRVAPVAEKLKVLDGGRKSDLEYYIEAGQQVLGTQQAAQEAVVEAQHAEEEVKAKNTKQIQKKKKAAAPSKGAGTNADRGVDFSSMTDEELDEWLAKHL